MLSPLRLDDRASAAADAARTCSPPCTINTASYQLRSGTHDICSMRGHVEAADPWKQLSTSHGPNPSTPPQKEAQVKQTWTMRCEVVVGGGGGGGGWGVTWSR